MGAEIGAHLKQPEQRAELSSKTQALVRRLRLRVMGRVCGAESELERVAESTVGRSYSLSRKTGSGIRHLRTDQLYRRGRLFSLGGGGNFGLGFWRQIVRR
jgi:hypothetical protein